MPKISKKKKRKKKKDLRKCLRDVLLCQMLTGSSKMHFLTFSTFLCEMGNLWKHVFEHCECQSIKGLNLDWIDFWKYRQKKKKKAQGGHKQEQSVKIDQELCSILFIHTSVVNKSLNRINTLILPLSVLYKGISYIDPSHNAMCYIS